MSWRCQLLLNEGTTLYVAYPWTKTYKFFLCWLCYSIVFVINFRNRVKTTIAFQSECASDEAERRAVDLLISGKVRSLADMTKAVDSVNAQAVQKVRVV